MKRLSRCSISGRLRQWNTTTWDVVLLIPLIRIPIGNFGTKVNTDLGGRHSQVGSLAGAAHLLNDNAGVQRWAQREQKSLVDQKGKAHLILIFSMNTNCESMAYRSFNFSIHEIRGVRKVTTGITGLWQPSEHSDVAFWSFDVGSSYHCEAKFTMCRIVHPLIGNVSWV